jgi:hypothetical protein
MVFPIFCPEIIDVSRFFIALGTIVILNNVVSRQTSIQSPYATVFQFLVPASVDI